MSLNPADIELAVKSKGSLIKDDFFADAVFEYMPSGSLVKYTGGYSLVFPCAVHGDKWAFRCWYVLISDAFNRYRLLTDYLRQHNIPYFSDIHYCEKGIVVNGQIYPTIRMKWIEGKLIKDYVKEIITDKKELRNLADKFLVLCRTLNSAHIAHGDLQHGNIIVDGKGELKLLDYDSVYVPTMGNSFLNEIDGLKDYQHPKRSNNKIASEKLDYFSQVIIYTSLLALSIAPSLAEKYQLFASESMLFTAKDFADFSRSKIYSDLKSLKDDNIDICLSWIKSSLAVKDINDLHPFRSLPIINSFAYNGSKFVGRKGVLFWEVKDADKVSIAPFNEKFERRGRKEVNVVSGLNTWEVTAENKEGQSTKKISFEAKELPSILYFKISDDQRKKYIGDVVDVEWECLNADKVTMMGSDVPLKSRQPIKVAQQINTYELKAYADEEVCSRSLVFDAFKTPTITLLASSTKLREGKGEKTKISWNVQDAQKAFLKYDDEKKDVELKSELEISPSKTTEYTLETVGLDGERTFEKKIVVEVCKEATISFKANAYHVISGSHVILSWNVENATKLMFERKGYSPKEVEASGFEEVEIDKDEKFDLIVTDAFGERRESLRVRKVLSPPLVKKVVVPEFKLGPVFNLKLEPKSFNLNTKQFEKRCANEVNITGLFSSLKLPSSSINDKYLIGKLENICSSTIKKNFEFRENLLSYFKRFKNSFRYGKQ